MDLEIIEAAYPLSFREQEATLLGQHLHHRHSVDLIGMKRVGISNFLRFFLHHQGVKERFISKNENHLFIPVDLNDLVERELYAFWTLTFKRIIDAVEHADLPESLQKKIEITFLSAIQANDLFLLLDGVRQTLTLLAQHNILPTIFFLRFDRIKDAITPEFFDNLSGLKDATHGKLCYVFTSYRSLDTLSPQTFTKAEFSAFSHVLYIKPLEEKDMRTIADHYQKRYKLTLSQALEKEFYALLGGNVQYLQIALIILHETKQESITTKEQLTELISQDERVNLFGEELWDSLLPVERDVLARISKGEEVTEEDKKHASYVFDTGIAQKSGNAWKMFSALFSEYVLTTVQNSSVREKELVFSKKEHMLFTLLEQHSGQICERDDIIEAVWPEYKEYGVSDWSIDRLIARVRAKLKKQVSPFEIKTIRTRGYMLTERV